VRNQRETATQGDHSKTQPHLNLLHWLWGLEGCGSRGNWGWLSSLGLRACRAGGRHIRITCTSVAGVAPTRGAASQSRSSKWCCRRSRQAQRLAQRPWAACVQGQMAATCGRELRTYTILRVAHVVPFKGAAVQKRPKLGAVAGACKRQPGHYS
jgi:hypothetical protein